MIKYFCWLENRGRAPTWGRGATTVSQPQSDATRLGRVVISKNIKVERRRQSKARYREISIDSKTFRPRRRRLLAPTPRPLFAPREEDKRRQLNEMSAFLVSDDKYSLLIALVRRAVLAGEGR